MLTHEQVVTLFEQDDNEYIKFERISADQRRHIRPDLCAFLYLHEKLGGDGDAVAGARHDEIWLDWDNLEGLTEEDVIYLKRCGVRWSDECDRLAMFAV